MSRIRKPETPAWCKKLPKAELHAHLSGSIRNETLRKLLNKPGNDHIRAKASGLLVPGAGRTLQQCFELFPIIHELIKDAPTLRTVTLQALEDFANENTVYLELRTTPRACETLSAEEYLRTVLTAVAEYHDEYPEGMVCRVLVSISRHLPVALAEGTLALTEQVLKSNDGLQELIIGMELSGNPSKGNWRDFRHIFLDARQRLGLRISLHFGEVDNEEECLSMLDFKPDRVGHAVILSKAVAERLVTQEPRIGVEVCLTSNLITESVGSIADHPVVTVLLPAAHPFCLCTDDSGVFETSLSDEYGRLVEFLELTQGETQKIAARGLELAFCKDREVIERVRKAFKKGIVP